VDLKKLGEILVDWLGGLSRLEQKFILVACVVALTVLQMLNGSEQFIVVAYDQLVHLLFLIQPLELLCLDVGQHGASYDGYQEYLID